MADFPSNIPIDVGSSPVPDAGIRVDRAENGKLRGRQMYDQTQYTITLVHGYLTEAQRTTLLDHYHAHIGLTFNLAAPWGDTYAVQYLDEPAGLPEANGQWSMTTQLAGELSA